MFDRLRNSVKAALPVRQRLAFLRGLIGREGRINFAFLDVSHEYSHLIKEFSIIYHGVAACGGKVYFDNTVGDTTGVARALYFIRHAYNGNMIEFRNCSWLPPGNAIWQPPW